MRPHLDYGDITYGQSNNEHLIQKKKKNQRTKYYPAVAITGAIKRISQSKLDSELGSESLKIMR